jgi:hypothetical protein
MSNGKRSEYLNSEKDRDKIRNLPHIHLQNALEKMLLKGRPAKVQDPLKRLLSDKVRTLKGTVTALLEEIKLRQNLDCNLINEIDEEICTKHGDIMNLLNVKPQYDLELYKEISRHRTHLENMVLDLEKEKRKEYLECWKDLMLLKEHLLSALKDYWDLIKKKELLQSD